MTSPSPQPQPHAKKPEAPVKDIEDAAVDEKSTHECLKKLDKTQGFMEYK